MSRFLCLTVIAICGLAVVACSSDSGSPTTTETARSFRMEGDGMAPTLRNGDQLPVEPYSESLPQRGDTIVFRSPTAVHRDFAKRVIGLPGDAIRIDDSAGKVFVNGAALPEDYARGLTHCYSQCNFTVPERTGAASLGDGGAMARAQFADPAQEEAACRQRGCYFVLGDNRQNSSDSRQGWLVPAENIIGRVTSNRSAQ